MASIMIQTFKYVIMFLFLGYVFEAFSVFQYGKQIEKQKNIYRIQKTLLFTIHGLGFLCLYFKNPNAELIGFYLMQVVLFAVIFLVVLLLLVAEIVDVFIVVLFSIFSSFSTFSSFIFIFIIIIILPRFFFAVKKVGQKRKGTWFPCQKVIQ